MCLLQYAEAPYQWAYEVMAPSTGDYQSRVEHRQQDGVVRGRYSLVDPDGSLRVVSYVAHPEDGFKATVEKVPVTSTTSTNTAHTYTNQHSHLSTPRQQQLNLNRPQHQQQHQQQFSTFTQQQQKQQQQRVIQSQRLRSFTQDSQDVNKQTYQRRTQPLYTLRQHHMTTPLQDTIDENSPFWLQHPFYTNFETLKYTPTGYILKPQLPAHFISPVHAAMHGSSSSSLNSDRTNQPAATFRSSDFQVEQTKPIIPSHFRPAQLRIRPGLLRDVE